MRAALFAIIALAVLVAGFLLVRQAGAQALPDGLEVNGSSTAAVRASPFRPAACGISPGGAGQGPVGQVPGKPGCFRINSAM